MRLCLPIIFIVTTSVVTLFSVKRFLRSCLPLSFLYLSTFTTHPNLSEYLHCVVGHHFARDFYVLVCLCLLQAEKFQGSRTVESLVNAALKRLKVYSYSLTASNFDTTTASTKRPWIITYCMDQGGGDCLDIVGCLKLAAILVSGTVFLFEHLVIHVLYRWQHVCYSRNVGKKK